MLLPVFQDLLRPQWREIIETLRLAGGLPVSELARRTGASYMKAKTHCDELAEAGYLTRTRLPRTAVGRPEIFYSLSVKADALFPQAGMEFTLDLLDELRAMHGESAPERLLFQYFSKLGERLVKSTSKLQTLADKAHKLAALREKEGYASRCEVELGQPVRIEEYHNPLQRVFERFPRAVTMELRMIEQVMSARVLRSELPADSTSPSRVVFEIQ
ncbi:MAG TPA: winged helix-turn-helix transcriptional regulator [Candidatus Paceibacterota bacterium]|nr:winged helix-turn-helix transcriptional regulator [Candidatus Paceibacterota bacterium]